MPFKSEKQRRWMYKNKPSMAKKWSEEEAKIGALKKIKDKYKKKK